MKKIKQTTPKPRPHEVFVVGYRADQVAHALSELVPNLAVLAFNASNKSIEQTTPPKVVTGDQVATAGHEQEEEALKNYLFAESILTVIGREADMPESETSEDMLQINKDRQIIESALDQGYVADAPITIRHFAKFRTKELAGFYAYKAKFQDLVFHSCGHIEETGEYQMRVTQDTTWTQLKISTITVFLRRLAGDFQGEYQGWTLNE